jgi:hypothetical protein
MQDGEQVDSEHRLDALQALGRQQAVVRDADVVDQRITGGELRRQRLQVLRLAHVDVGVMGHARRPRIVDAVRSVDEE